MKKLTLIIAIVFAALPSLHTQNSCLPDGIVFTSQAQIDAFPSDYPGCTEIEGWLSIYDSDDGFSDITNVDSLYPLTTVGGLFVGGGINGSTNDVLTSLDGLRNVTSVNGSMALSVNFSLESLSGLENIQSIDGPLTISQNPKLKNLDGLEGLTAINGRLDLWLGALNDISGLGGIDHSTITYLYIFENWGLSVCEIPSICAYLENGGAANISLNASGCNSQQEVEAACLAVSVDDLLSEDAVQVFPNPTTGIIRINLPDNVENGMVRIRDTKGNLVVRTRQVRSGEIDLSAAPAGLYMLEFQNGRQSVFKRFVKR